MNNCFGIALDLKLRCLHWGVRLSEVRGNAYMRHSGTDSAVPLITALLTSQLLPNCKLYIEEQGEHFSGGALDAFIKTVIAVHYEN